MICYNHRDKQAVAICKNCNKAICEECAIPDENGFACSEKCHQEITLAHAMYEKAKMAYGLKPGRMPLTTIFLIVAGIPFALFGTFELLSGKSFGYFSLTMGIIFIFIGILSYINVKKSGIKS
jgi:hypothetical protein